MGRHVSNTGNCRIHVMTRNESEKERWVEHAKENGMTLTELVRSAVQQFIMPPEETLDENDLREKVYELRDELKECKEEIETQRQAIKGYKSEIESLKNKAFAEDSMGHHTFGKNLVDLLRTSNRPLREHELFKLLEIDSNDLSNTKGLANQLRNLEILGLVECAAGRWRWSNE